MILFTVYEIPYLPDSRKCQLRLTASLNMRDTFMGRYDTDMTRLSDIKAYVHLIRICGRRHIRTLVG